MKAINLDQRLAGISTPEAGYPWVEPGDYGAKWSKYAVLNILEFWLTDAIAGQVSVAGLVHGRYHDRSFRGDDVMLSPTFPTSA